MDQEVNSFTSFLCYVRSYKDGMARMSKLAAQLKTLKHQVTNESYIPLCKRWSTTDRVRHGIYFFGNLTTYMTFLSSIRREIVRATVAELKAVSAPEQRHCTGQWFGCYSAA